VSRRRVAKGRAEHNRRYVDAVRRQIKFFRIGCHERPFNTPYYYADVTEVLRRGESLEDFERTYGGAR
jgi:hypothetical protein